MARRRPKRAAPQPPCVDERGSRCSTTQGQRRSGRILPRPGGCIEPTCGSAIVPPTLPQPPAHSSPAHTRAGMSRLPPMLLLRADELPPACARLPAAEVDPQRHTCLPCRVHVLFFFLFKSSPFGFVVGLAVREAKFWVCYSVTVHNSNHGMCIMFGLFYWR